MRSYFISLVSGIVAISILGVVAIVLLDHNVGAEYVIPVLIGFLSPTIVALLGLLKSEQNGMQLELAARKLDVVGTQAVVAQQSAQVAQQSAQQAHAVALANGELIRKINGGQVGDV